MTGVLGPTRRKGHRCGIATDRVRKLWAWRVLSFLVGDIQGQMGTDWRIQADIYQVSLNYSASRGKDASG